MTQRSLIPLAAELSTAKRGYVPVLQDHAGERGALAGLRATAPDVLGSVTPVIEIVGRKTTHMTRNAIKGHIKRLAEALDTSQPIYIDFIRADPARMLDTPRGPLATADIAYDAARRRGLQFMPVVWSDSRSAHVNAAANASIIDRRGLALRHRLLGRAPIGSASAADPLVATLASLQVGAEDVDLLLDLEYLAPDTEISPDRISRLVTQYVAAGKWRRIVLVGSSIPATLGCVPEGENGFIERREWQLWRSLSSEVHDILDFGDYGIQHPRPPKDSGPGMRANIRYSIDDQHFVVRGRGEVRIEGAAQYAGLCERIVESGFFAGDSYSWGDDLIKRCADGSLSPGDQTMWRAAGTAHHIRIASSQAQTLG